LPDDLEALFSFDLEDLFFPIRFILPGNLDTNRFTKARDVLFSERFTLNPESNKKGVGPRIRHDYGQYLNLVYPYISIGQLGI